MEMMKTPHASASPWASEGEPCPPWVIFHVPHDSTFIPPGVRQQITLSDAELSEELIKMTDHLTLRLFASGIPAAQVVRTPVSRLVVDVERFPEDHVEPMAERGMGAVYRVTSGLTPLRHRPVDGEREALMRDYYHPHHARLEAAVSAAIDLHGRCLVLDCHSFPSQALPYEFADARAKRPDICIGTDTFHTRDELGDAFMAAFQHAGWSVELNQPFAGALVPSSRYGKDRRVQGVMVEVNRKLYLNESDATPLAGFDTVAQRVRNCCFAAMAACCP